MNIIEHARDWAIYHRESDPNKAFVLSPTGSLRTFRGEDSLTKAWEFVKRAIEDT